MSGIEGVVKAQGRSYRYLIGAINAKGGHMTDGKFWKCRTHWEGMGFSDWEYEVMAEALGVTAERLKGDGLEVYADTV